MWMIRDGAGGRCDAAFAIRLCQAGESRDRDVITICESTDSYGKPGPSDRKPGSRECSVYRITRCQIDVKQRRSGDNPG